MAANFDFYQSGQGDPSGNGYWSQQIANAPPIPEQGGVEWADYGKSILGGGASIVQGVGWLANVMGAEDIGTSIQTLGSDAVDYWNDSLSDPAKAEISKQIIRKNDETDEYEWGDPSFHTVGLMGAQSLLGTAAGMGVGAGLTKVLQVFANPFGRAALVAATKAPIAAPGVMGVGITAAAKKAAVGKLKLVDMVLGGAGFGAGEGSIGGISAGASVYDNIMSLSPEKLLANPRYKQIYESTDNSISELERHQYAADTVAKEASTSAGWHSGLTTALLGAPMGAYFGRILGGAKLQDTLLKAIGVGAAGEAAQEFGQSGAEQLISNYQTGKYDPEVDIWDDVLNAAVSGAMAGGLLGGVVGPAAVKGSRQEIQQDAQLDTAVRAETFGKIGGPLQPAGKKAIEAGGDPTQIVSVINAVVNEKISVGDALDTLEQIGAAATEAKAQAEAAPEAAEEAQPEPEPEPVQTAVGPEAQPEAEKPAISESATEADLETVNLLDMKLDAATFQFKADSDTAGVTGALKGVKKFEKIKAGTGIIYEDMAGDRFVVDSHQRKNLADTLYEQGSQPREDFEIPAYVLKASKGVTPEEATAAAALKNIAEGTGSAVDAAKVMRQFGPMSEEVMNLPPNKALVKQGRGLTNLDDEAFGRVVNKVIPAKQGAVVGELIPTDGDLQNAAIEVLRRTEPANDVQARSIVEQVRTAGVEVQTTEDLFGEQVMAKSLYLERAKVLDAAIKTAKRDKATFATLTNRKAVIAQTGENVLDTEANLAAMTQAQQAVSMLATVANQKGPISDALTEAAREVAAGAKPGTVAQGFLQAAVAQIEAGVPTRGQPRQAEQGESQAVDTEGGPTVTSDNLIATDTGLYADAALFSRAKGVDPTGHCFENCGRYIMNSTDPNLVLMHGYMVGQGPIEGVRFAHAWLERKNAEAAREVAAGAKAIGGDLTQLAAKDADLLARSAMDLTTDDRIEDPIEMPAVLYRSIGQAEVMFEYNQQEALKHMANTGHFGPWEMSEHPDAEALRTEPLEQVSDESLYSRRSEETERRERYVNNQIDRLIESFDGRSFDQQTDEERTKLHELRLQLPSAGEQQQAAKDRLAEKASAKRTEALKKEEARRDRIRNTGQLDLFSRRGKPLSEVTITREYAIEGTDEVYDVELNAEVLVRQLDKRISIIEQLRECVRA